MPTWLKRALLILLCVSVCGGAPLVYFRLAPPVYVAEAIIQAQATRDQLVDLSTVFPREFRLPMPLPRLWELGDTIPSAYLLSRVAASNAWAQESALPLLPPEDEMRLRERVAVLRRLIDVQIRPDEGVLVISAAYGKPEPAARLANAFAEELVRYFQGPSLEEIQAVIRRLEEYLRERETRPGPPAAAAVATGLPPELDPRYSDLLGTIREMSRRRTDLLLESFDREAQYKMAQHAGTNWSAVAKLPAIAADPDVDATQKAILRRELDILRLRQRIPPDPEGLTEASKELEDLHRRLAQAVQTAVNALHNACELDRARAEALQEEYEAKVREAQQTLAAADAAETQDSLEQQLAAEQELYKRLLLQVEQVKLARSLLNWPLRVMKPATTPTAPARSDEFLIVASGGGVGLVLGLLLTLLLALVDVSIKSLRDLENATDVPVLGTIPRVVDSQSAGAAAEAFRSLHAVLAATEKDRETRSVIFTSPLPEAGKTFCAVSYAVSLAQQGLTTLLIDADLRRPTADQHVPGIQKRGKGLCDYLRQSPPAAGKPASGPAPQKNGLSFTELRRKQSTSAEPGTGPSNGANAPPPEDSKELSLDDLIRPSKIDNLSFLSAGSITPRSSELLAREQGLLRLFSDALSRHERIVIDSPPVLGVSDTLLLARRADAVCLVVRCGRTPRKATRRAAGLLERTGVPVLGTVLNELAAREASYYSSYYSAAADAEAP